MKKRYKHLANNGNFSVSAPPSQRLTLDDAIDFLCALGMNKATAGRDAIILYAQDCGFEQGEQDNENDN